MFQDSHARFAIIALISAAALAIGPQLLFIAPNFFLMPCLIALLPTIIFGSALAAGRLNRLLAQSAAPSWSPSPVAPPMPIPTPPPAQPVTPAPQPPAPPVTPPLIDPDR